MAEFEEKETGGWNLVECSLDSHEGGAAFQGPKRLRCLDGLVGRKGGKKVSI